MSYGLETPGRAGLVLSHMAGYQVGGRSAPGRIPEERRYVKCRICMGILT